MEGLDIQLGAQVIYAHFVGCQQLHQRFSLADVQAMDELLQLVLLKQDS